VHGGDEQAQLAELQTGDEVGVELETRAALRRRRLELELTAKGLQRGRELLGVDMERGDERGQPV
jgi:hypothetical protein